MVPFIAIADILRGLGLSAPEIAAARPDDGLLLLEDFGDGTFTRLIAQGADTTALYRLAVDALAVIHRDFRPEQAASIDLPRYDADLFIDQVMLLADVYIRRGPGPRPEHAPSGASWSRHGDQWSPTR